MPHEEQHGLITPDNHVPSEQGFRVSQAPDQGSESPSQGGDTGSNPVGTTGISAVAPLAGHSLGHFDRILIVGDRVLLAGHRGADRFTSV